MQVIVKIREGICREWLHWKEEQMNRPSGTLWSMIQIPAGGLGLEREKKYNSAALGEAGSCLSFHHIYITVSWSSVCPASGQHWVKSLARRQAPFWLAPGP